MNRQEKLRARALFSIIVFAIGTKLGDLTPTIYAQTGKNAFWIMPFVSFLVIFPSVLVLVYLLKKYKDKNLISLTNQILGKKIGWMLTLLFFMTVFFALTIESRNAIDTLSMYFPESPELSLYITFMFVCAFGAKKGLSIIGSTCWAILPYVKISILILFIIALKDVVWLRIYPIFGSGFKDVMFEGAKKGSVFGDLILITMAFPLIKDQKAFNKGFFIGSFFVLFELVLFYLLYCTFFDYKSITKVAFPFHEITQYVNLGTFFTNIETFFMTFWVLSAFLRFIIYLYITTWIFGELFKIKEFEPLIFIFGLVTIVIGMIFEGPIFQLLSIRSTYLNMITPLLVVFPLLLWIVAKVKGELKQV